MLKNLMSRKKKGGERDYTSELNGYLSGIFMCQHKDDMCM